MHEDLFDRHDENQLRQFAPNCEGFPEFFVTGDLAGSSIPKGFGMTGYEKEQADAWIDQQIFKRIDTMIAQAVRNDQGPVVVDGDKSGRIAFG